MTMTPLIYKFPWILPKSSCSLSESQVLTSAALLGISIFCSPIEHQSRMERLLSSLPQLSLSNLAILISGPESAIILQKPLKLRIFSSGCALRLELSSQYKVNLPQILSDSVSLSSASAQITRFILILHAKIAQIYPVLSKAMGPLLSIFISLILLSILVTKNTYLIT